MSLGTSIHTTRRTPFRRKLLFQTSCTSPAVDGDILYIGTQPQALLISLDRLTGGPIADIRVNQINQPSSTGHYHAITHTLRRKGICRCRKSRRSCRTPGSQLQMLLFCRQYGPSRIEPYKSPIPRLKRIPWSLNRRSGNLYALSAQAGMILWATSTSPNGNVGGLI